MKHKTWFRLVIKAVGLLLVGLSLPQLVAATAQTAFSIIAARQPGTTVASPHWWWWFVTTGAKPLLQLLMGLYLLFGGKWIVDKIIPSNRPYCPECGYDVSRTATPQCPECGAQILANQPGAVP